MVYPPGLKGTDRLTFLATLFGAVEINVTFYRPIPPDYARRWLAAVDRNPDFRFTAKVWQVFTHERRLPEPELAQFQEGLAPLLAGGKLGVLLAQFPYSFHNTEENRAYLVQLKAALPGFSPGRGGAPPLLAAAGGTGVFGRGGSGFLQHRPADGVLPHGCDALGHRHPGLPALPRAAPRGLVRVRGRPGRPLRLPVLPRGTGGFGGPDPGTGGKGRETYVIFNNHPAGQAVANALELAHRLNPSRRLPVPPGLLAAFPRLAETVMGEKPGEDESG